MNHDWRSELTRRVLVILTVGVSSIMILLSGAWILGASLRNPRPWSELAAELPWSLFALFAILLAGVFALVRVASARVRLALHGRGVEPDTQGKPGVSAWWVIDGVRVGWTGGSSNAWIFLCLVVLVTFGRGVDYVDHLWILIWPLLYCAFLLLLLLYFQRRPRWMGRSRPSEPGYLPGLASTLHADVPTWRDLLADRPGRLSRQRILTGDTGFDDEVALAGAPVDAFAILSPTAREVVRALVRAGGQFDGHRVFLPTGLFLPVEARLRAGLRLLPAAVAVFDVQRPDRDAITERVLHDPVPEVRLRALDAWLRHARDADGLVLGAVLAEAGMDQHAPPDVLAADLDGVAPVVARALLHELTRRGELRHLPAIEGVTGSEILLRAADEARAAIQGRAGPEAAGRLALYGGEDMSGAVSEVAAAVGGVSVVADPVASRSERT